MSNSPAALPTPVPVTRLPGPQGDVAVRFEVLSPAHCGWWHAHVQSRIDASDEPRADKGWRWPRLVQLQSLSTATRAVQGTCLTIRSTAHASSIPIGMCLLVTPHPHLPDPDRDAIFVWWLTDMPRFAAAAEHIELPGLIGSALLDYALCLAMARGFHGRVDLHASAAGGSELAEWYGNKRKMRPVSEDMELSGIRHLFMPNDGRYFCYEPPVSAQALALLQAWR